MKLYNIKNIDELFKVIDKCTGKVELVGQDLRLNLKSKLAQYFSLAQMFSDGEIPEMEILTYNQEDTDMILRFMIDGERY